MIFDTSILIYAGRGVISAKDLLLSTPHRAISAVTYLEYLPFCRNKQELSIFEKMLNALQFTIYEIDPNISYQARQMAKQHAHQGMEMSDVLIAATAMAKHETLCTSNKKQFAAVPGLMLELYNPES